MELDRDHFKSLNLDLILDILSRLDGCTVAAMAATCSDLRDAAGDERLWKKLCHNTWPSTSKVQLLFREEKGFKSLYANAFPLILHNGKGRVPRTISSATAAFHILSSPTDFISFIDIYYNGQCILSKVADGIFEGTRGSCNENFQTFLCYPFKFDVVVCPDGASEDFQDFDIVTTLPSSAFMDHEERRDVSNKIVGDLRLSWILIDRTNQKAANISSWRPRSIQKGYSFDEGYIICFGSAVTMDDNISTHMSAEFVIKAKCKLLLDQGCIRWKEITLLIKDSDGSHLNGVQSMKVMKQALTSSRSVNHYTVDTSYQQFCKQKIKMRLRKEQEESLANLICATIAIASLLGICYGCATLL